MQSVPGVCVCDNQVDESGTGVCRVHRFGPDDLPSWMEVWELREGAVVGVQRLQGTHSYHIIDTLRDTEVDDDWLNGTTRRKGRQEDFVQLEDLLPLFHLPLKKAAAELGMW